MGNSNSSESYNWDSVSFFRKLSSDVTYQVGNESTIVKITKSTTTHNPKTDAYRSCSNCHKHVNYHSSENKKCPK